MDAGNVPATFLTGLINHQILSFPFLIQRAVDDGVKVQKQYLKNFSSTGIPETPF